MEYHPLEKRIIVICILAVVLLVMGSLSNVVGYQSVKSTVNDSPLFKIRTQRENNQQQNTFTSQYLGKGNNNNLLILPRLNEKDSLREVVNKIRVMDEDTFNRFVEYTVSQINQKDNLKGIDVKEVINELRQIRKSTQNIIVYRDTNDDRITYFSNFYPSFCWTPGCFVILSIFVIAVLLYYTTRPPSSLVPCSSDFKC